ncbi:hypothetical protein C8J56DRAFT_797063 [Mycena floridula]|nr:hypothetical protein C8J56DRAFT_797063 [Mycena floridula]
MVSHSSAPLPRASSSLVTASSIPKPNDCPEWMNDIWDVNIGRVQNVSFVPLVAKWIILERSYGFETSSRGLATKKRPDEVKWWIGRGRRVLPTVTDVERFADSWWTWWIYLNPDWREKSEDGTRLLTGGAGKWEKLRLPGLNGVFSVVSCLGWWLSALEGSTPGEAWNSAAEEVLWVLDEMLKSRFVNFARSSTLVLTWL